MIFFDESGFPVDQSGDNMDSLVRASILKADSANKWNSFNFFAYIIRKGFFVRHPKKFPAVNESNCSRDQITMGIFALDRLKLHADAKEVFKAHLKRFFFSQNTERDWPSSKKMLRPHWFFKDSNPSSLTFPVRWNWKKLKFDFPEKMPSIERRYFDCADFLLPHQWGMMIIAGRVRAAYWLLPLCYIFHLGSLAFTRFSKHHEMNQIIAESSIYRTLWLFRRVVPKWSQVSRDYWHKRNELEYHLLLEQLVGPISEPSPQPQSIQAGS